MPRHKVNVDALPTKNDGDGWARWYRLEWGEVVGGRIRRARTERGWSLGELARQVPRPGEIPLVGPRAPRVIDPQKLRERWQYGKPRPHYTAGYFSRLERGWTSPPLYVYIATAEVLGITPGRLMGPDASESDLRAQEALLVKTIRRLGIEPEALARLLR